MTGGTIGTSAIGDVEPPSSVTETPVTDGQQPIRSLNSSLDGPEKKNTKDDELRRDLVELLRRCLPNEEQYVQKEARRIIGLFPRQLDVFLGHLRHAMSVRHESPIGYAIVQTNREARSPPR